MMKKNVHFWRYRMRFNQVTIVVFKIFFIQFYLCNSNSDEIRWVFFTSISIDFHFDKNHWLEFVNGYDLIGYKVCSLFELCMIHFSNYLFEFLFLFWWNIDIFYEFHVLHSEYFECFIQQNNFLRKYLLWDAQFISMKSRELFGCFQYFRVFRRWWVLNEESLYWKHPNFH